MIPIVYEFNTKEGKVSQQQTKKDTQQKTLSVDVLHYYSKSMWMWKMWPQQRCDLDWLQWHANQHNWFKVSLLSFVVNGYYLRFDDCILKHKMFAPDWSVCVTLSLSHFFSVSCPRCTKLTRWGGRRGETCWPSSVSARTAAKLCPIRGRSLRQRFTETGATPLLQHPRGSCMHRHDTHRKI